MPENLLLTNLSKQWSYYNCCWRRDKHGKPQI